MQLNLLRFNNYSNRIIKKYDTLEEYPQALHEFPSFNFNPNDGISTTIIIGQGEILEIPDYCLLIDESDNSIISRWFVIEAVRTRGGQYNITLYRDTVADYYDVIKGSPALIEKATLEEDSPLIFNNEDVSFNQIKKDEALLKDKTGCPWLIGYYAKNAADIRGSVPINKDIPAEKLNYSDINNWPIYQKAKDSIKGPALSGKYVFKVAMGPALNPGYTLMKVNFKTGDTSRSITKGPVQLQVFGGGFTDNQFKNYFVAYGLNNLNPAPYANTATEGEIDEILSYSGKTVRTLDGKYYKISVTSGQVSSTVSIPSGELYNNLNTILKDNMGFYGDTNSSTYSFEFTSNSYSLSVTELTDLEVTYDLTSTNKLITIDAAYNIFAIPYGEILVSNSQGIICKTNKDVALATATAIATNHASNIYDIQLLPYCPLQELIGLDDIRVTDESQYSLIVDEEDDSTVGVIFNVNKSSFSFDIYNIEFKSGRTSIPVSNNNIEKKLNNECDKWRLTSPNFSNYFDFSVEKNNGVQYFNIDCSYKPYTPYIHINPNFNGLYGEDYNDVRGLILGGDFSISRIDSAWQQYQLQNKNFQETFDRQIQNLEFQNKYQRVQDIATAITGTATGAVGGAFVGSTFGPAGAVAGAVAGGAASGIGGVIDVNIKEKLRNENIDFTRDLFGYQLGNIQALPYTISKVSAFNNNNKIFPVLEYYSCTNTEKKAFLNKLAYNGMTVMVIGSILDYIENGWSYTIDDETITSKNYIKAKIIRLNDLGDDYHLANVIIGELNQGVYL